MVTDSNKPFVSVIIPMRNEENYIGQCIDSFIHQDYDRDFYEILIVDGKSTDNSRQIVEDKAIECKQLRLLTNVQHTTPYGLNWGIQNAHGDICIIFSAHAYAAPDFISQNIQALQITNADCVGGHPNLIGENSWARAVAKAMASPFGMGGVHFRSSDKPGFVDTVGFGAYRKAVFERVGLFDLALTRNQDDEFNYRLRRAGGKIYFAPQIQSYAYSRSNFKRLCVQYFLWGRYKPQVFIKSHTWPMVRHLVPTIFVSSIFFLTIAAPFVFLARLVLAVIWVAYFVMAISFSTQAYDPQDIPASLLQLPIFLTMHTSYGCGFVVGLVDLVRFGTNSKPSTHFRNLC